MMTKEQVMDLQTAVARTGQVAKDKRSAGAALVADAIEMVLDELDHREGSRVLGPEQCCERGCNGGACESCTCCAAGWCVTGRDGLPEDVEDLAIWLKYARPHNPLAEAYAQALDRVADLEVTAHAASEYVMSGLCGDTAEHQREALHALIEVARTDR